MDDELRKVIMADLYRHGCTSWRDFFRAFLLYPGFRFVYYLRKCSHFYAKRGLINKARFYYNVLWLNHLKVRYGFQLSWKTDIGPGLYINHFGPVIVNTGATLGRNVNLAPGCVIGRTFRGRACGVPKVGDRVWIGSNAVLVGNISIGNDAMIAPGAFVTFDVPDHALVVGNPGRVVSGVGSKGYVGHLPPDCGEPA